MDKEKTKPVDSSRLGPLQYAIWENQSQNGKRFLNVEFIRAYQDHDGWHEEKLRLREDQVVLLGHLLKRCVRSLEAHAGSDSTATA